MAREAMTKLGKIRKDRQNTTNMVKTLVFSISMCAMETWTIKNSDWHRIDAFEMLCWRSMLRVPWTEIGTNVSILNEITVAGKLSKTCCRRISKYSGRTYSQMRWGQSRKTDSSGKSTWMKTPTQITKQVDRPSEKYYKHPFTKFSKRNRRS